MKRTFLAKRNALLSPANISWGTVALACALLALLFRLFAPNLFWQALAPAFRAGDRIASANNRFFAGFGDSATLAAKNEELLKQNDALANENAALLQKIGRLTALLDVPIASSGILAGVVARPPESPYDTLVLAAGTNVGVALGQEALGEGGVPVGVVSAVSADFSRVTLFSAPGMVTHGWVGANTPLAIKGAGAGAMTASLSRAADIVVGDAVSAPGPGMLPIGSVVRIDSDPSSVGATLYIRPKINPFSISWVLLRDTGVAFENPVSLTGSTSL